MTDPLGLLSNVGPLQRPLAPSPRTGQGAEANNGTNFKDMLQQQIDRVNQLQSDANMAMEDLAAGRRDDLEGVIVATQKADIAFKMLLQVRNKMMDAYEEIRQIRI
jgi:flagellar hook-basal body complex protein FliE